MNRHPRRRITAPPVEELLAQWRARPVLVSTTGDFAERFGVRWEPSFDHRKRRVVADL